MDSLNGEIQITITMQCISMSFLNGYTQTIHCCFNGDLLPETNAHVQFVSGRQGKEEPKIDWETGERRFPNRQNMPRWAGSDKMVLHLPAQ